MSENTRLPTHLEVSGLIKLAQSMGAFGTVLQKGERDAGVILLLTKDRGGPGVLWERMPQLDGTRPFRQSRTETAETSSEFQAYCERRCRQDPDCWLVELDVPNPDRFVPGAKA